MDRRPVVVGVGSGVTAFALVAAVIITVIEVAPVAGILGVLAGAMAALLTAAGVALQFGRLRPRRRALAEGAAGTGYALAAFGAVTYVDAPMVGSLGTTAVVGLCVLVGVLTGVVAWRRDRPASSL